MKDDTFKKTELKPNFNPNYTKIENAAEKNNWGATWKKVKSTKGE